MRLTRQVDESCQILIQKAEYPTDLQLAFVVRAQYLTDRIVQTMRVNEWEAAAPSTTTLELHIKAFQSEITTMKGFLPPSIQSNGRPNIFDYFCGANISQGLCSCTLTLQLSDYMK